MISLLLAIVNQLFSLVSPQIFRLLVDNYATKIAEFTELSYVKWVWTLLLIGVLAAGVSRVAKTFQDYYVSLMSQTIGSKLYAEWIGHAFSLPYKEFEDRQSGALLDKLQKARLDIQNLLNSFINTVFLTSIGMLIVLVYAFYVHRLIGTVFSIMVPILAWTTMLISKKIRKSQAFIVKKSAELSWATVENIKNVTLIKSLWLEQQEIEHLTWVNNQLIDLEIDKIKLIKTLSFSQGTMINFLRSLLQFIMLWLVFRWYISLGEFFGLLFYSFLMFNPLYELPTVATNFQEAKASSETLEEIFALEPEKKKEWARVLDHVSSLEARNISFAYEEDNALQNLSRQVEKGETIAFVWPSGSGKSTMIKLLCGLYVAQSWDLLINGVSVDDIDHGSIKHHLGIVAQDTQLFSGTIKENLLFVQPDASEEDCLVALKQAQLWEMVQGKEKWLETRIGEGWLKLSWGQKQRLAIARALLRRPDLLVFDEATSSLDSIVEGKITETIKSIAEKNDHLITILVAHRLSTVMHADRIYVLEWGEMVESGNHSELLEKNGLYSALWRQQGGVF